MTLTYTYFLVIWSDGETINVRDFSLTELKETNEWDLSEEVIEELSELKEDEEYIFDEFGTHISFTRCDREYIL